MSTTEKPAQQPVPKKDSSSAPASAGNGSGGGSGSGADSALAEMIRKRTVHVVETEQQLPAPQRRGNAS